MPVANERDKYEVSLFKPFTVLVTASKIDGEEVTDGVAQEKGA